MKSVLNVYRGTINNHLTRHSAIRGSDEGAAEAAKKAAEAETAKKEAEAAKKVEFTPEQQDIFNRKMAEEKRQWQAANAKTVDELKKMQAQASTTEAQKKELQTQIDQLRTQHMSKEELAKQEQENKAKEYQNQLQTEKTRGDKWEKLYHVETVKRSLQDEAIAADAYSALQIVSILESKTRLVPETDETTGQETGRLIPRVHLEEQDKDGKFITLDLTVKEALTKMKNTPEKYGNLFKSTLAGGLGQGGNAAGKGKKKSVADMTTEEYLAARAKEPNLAFVDKKD